LLENKKKIVFFSVVGVCAAILVAVGIFLTTRNVRKIVQSVSQMQLPDFSLPSPDIALPNLNNISGTPLTAEETVSPDGESGASDMTSETSPAQEPVQP
ncbi:MAG: hypothetical protein ACREHG_00345, partial [Candidatus Saccharimonadales bacterium]